MMDADAQRASARAIREALVGKTIAGRYVLKGLLGHGGMGAVYEAEHLGLGKRVAIKFVDSEFATDERVVARFAREARAMSAVESAHIVAVFDAGTEDGRPYLVMERLRGEDLGERLRRRRRVPLADALHVTAQILKGLGRAHAAGIVHRDLKPDNVFLLEHDLDPLFAKIVDFGISKIERPRAGTTPLALTGRGTVLGTPFYMSPEQAQAQPDVDGRSDLYSVGAILFECLSGRPPHTGESYEQVILSICMRDAPDLRAIEPSVPAAVAAFVARSLARDRRQRFSSAERMLAALHEIAVVERSRVPLDPMPAETLLSAEPRRDDGRGSPRAAASRPEISVATRLGLPELSDAAVAAEPLVEAPSDGSPNAQPTERSPISESPQDLPAPMGGARPRTVVSSGDESASETAIDPRTTSRRGPGRSVSRVIVTAFVAMLTGVATMVGILHFVGRESDTPLATATVASGSEAVPSATAKAMASAAGPSTNDVLTVEDAGVPASDASAIVVPVALRQAPSTASDPSPKVRPTGSARPSTQASTSASAKSPSVSSTKPLDIQRELP